MNGGATLYWYALLEEYLKNVPRRRFKVLLRQVETPAVHRNSQWNGYDSERAADMGIWEWISRDRSRIEWLHKGGVVVSRVRSCGVSQRVF